jgi:hypothetical protein
MPITTVQRNENSLASVCIPVTFVSQLMMWTLVNKPGYTIVALLPELKSKMHLMPCHQSLSATALYLECQKLSMWEI